MQCESLRGNVTNRFQSCPKSARFGTCWNETEPQEPQLAPCRLYVNDTTVVNVDSVGTKVTVNPRALMPGATYTVHVGDGVFELKEDGTLKSEFSTPTYSKRASLFCALRLSLTRKAWP